MRQSEFGDLARDRIAELRFEVNRQHRHVLVQLFQFTLERVGSQVMCFVGELLHRVREAHFEEHGFQILGRIQLLPNRVAR